MNQIGVIQGIEHKIGVWSDRLTETESDLAAQEAIIAAPFAKQAELDAKTSRFNEVMSILNPKDEQVIGDDGDVQYQARTQREDTSNCITRGMTDEERYEILKDKKVYLNAKVDMSALRDIEAKIGQKTDIADELTPSMRRNLFRTVGREFGVFKQYYSQDFKLSFSFGTGNMRHSLNKQGKNYHDFAKMLTCFDDVINSAIGVEVHNRNDEGYKSDLTLDNVYVLVSAFEDGNRVVPVKLEVKEFYDKENSLYVAISLESIKKDEVVAQEVIENDVTPDARSSEVRIADLFAKINPIDETFLKYVPKQFLTQAPVSQAISSAKTSIMQIPALFKHKAVKFGDVNIDIGGGRFDLATNYLASIGTTNLVFDPFNRPETTNASTLDYLHSGKRADTATCANVLNVIAEEEARKNVILEVAKAIKPDGTAYFMVYEGNGTGIGKETSAGYQNNRKTADYVQEISQWFDSVQRSGKLITATKPKKNLPKAAWELSPGNAVLYQQRTSPLTDREVLSIAASEVNVEGLTDGERDARAGALEALFCSPPPCLSPDYTHNKCHGQYFYLISIINVPPTMSTRPNAAFLLRRSLNTSAEKPIETRMLSLSMGTTTLARPSCSAL